MKPTPPKEYAKLSRVQAALLYNWVMGNKELCATTTAEILAEKASAALTFTVTVSMVSGMRRECGVGTTLGRGGQRSRTAIKIIARSLVELHRSLGTLVPNELLEIANGPA